MKNSIIKLVSRPKIVIPVTMIIALAIGAISYGAIGKPPIVTLPSSDQKLATSSQGTYDISTDLAFLKSGRLATVSVHIGDVVKKGDTLATLDASDTLGTINQAKGALELAKAQYASLNIQYSNAKTQQDVLVTNAHRTLLSGGLSAIARNTVIGSSWTVDENQIPQISGTYTCDKEGSYEISPYASGASNGYSFEFTGLESGTGNVTYYTPQPLGSCGLSIQFPVGYYSASIKWVIDIPNTRSSSYATNKNAYDLAIATRDQVLKQFEANLGKDSTSNANIAQATIDSAEGAYEVALAAYRNTIIVAPIDGVISFIDPNLKVGQTITANKTLITIAKQ
jgi:multidrug efflux pump subunit AcrA (membrane-fusion protein)